MTLKEHVFALIDAKFKLMAALEDVDLQLKEAYQALAEIPSNSIFIPIEERVKETPPIEIPPQVIVQIDIPKKSERIYKTKNRRIIKPCENCGVDTLMFKKGKFCKPCFKIVQGARMRAGWQRKVERMAKEHMDRMINDREN